MAILCIIILVKVTNHFYEKYVLFWKYEGTFFLSNFKIL